MAVITLRCSASREGQSTGGGDIQGLRSAIYYGHTSIVGVARYGLDHLGRPLARQPDLGSRYLLEQGKRPWTTVRKHATASSRHTRTRPPVPSRPGASISPTASSAPGPVSRWFW